MIIYKLTNIVNGKEYVGKTTGKLLDRWKEHVYEAKTGGSRLICKAIRKYGEENFIKAIIDVASSIKELNKKEIQWISELNTRCFDGGAGYNMTLGGEGSAGFNLSEKSKQKISENKSEKVMDVITGQIFNSTKELAHFYEISREYANKLICGLANSKKGYIFRHLDPIKRKKADKMNKKVKPSRSIPQPVLCVENGNEYCSIKEASEKLDISKANIGNVLQGRAFTAGGFHFIYLNKKNTSKEPIKSNLNHKAY